jgi:deoxyribose-phosphate aldolase
LFVLNLLCINLGEVKVDIAKYIDHAVLKPETTETEVKKACEEAKKYGFYSVCVNGANVAFAYEQLKETDVKVAAVIGFPLGAMTSEVKAFEAKNVIDNGAGEIDMVINIGALKEGNTEKVLDDIKAVVDIAKGRAIVKVIIETCLLTDKEKIQACKLSIIFLCSSLTLIRIALVVIFTILTLFFCQFFFFFQFFDGVFFYAVGNKGSDFR